MLKRTYPGDAANIFVRCLLSDIGAIAGGFTKQDWERTLAYFGYQCAYTGKNLTSEDAVMDHVIPHNREACGLHVYGNLIPASKEANSAKSSQDFRDFLRNDTNCLGDMSETEREERIRSIERFMADSGYEQNMEKLKDLQLFCYKEYEMIKTMCEANKKYFQAFLQQPTQINEHDGGGYFVNEASLQQDEEEALLIEFEFNPIGEFKQKLLEAKKAYITEFYLDGKKKVVAWNANRLTESSNLMNNIRSKTNYRKGMYQQLGIEKLYVSISEPQS